MSGLTGLAQRAGRVARRNALQLERGLAQRRASEQALRGAGDLRPGLVVGAGGARRYLLYLPSGMQPGRRLPLLVMLHGCDQDARSFAASTRMNRVAEREHFAVLYPEQDRLANLNGCWHWFDLDSGRAQAEAGSVLRAIDRVCLQHPIDPAAVAIAGLSAGASLAALLAVAHPWRFCAVALHSGVPVGAAHSAAGALRAMRGRGPSMPLPPLPLFPLFPGAPLGAAAQWPPLLVLHGTSDAVVAPDNGRSAALRWAEARGASAQPVRELQRGQRHALRISDFKVGRRTAVRWVEIVGLGHAWSGGAAGQRHSDPRGPDASRMVWRFVAQQFGKG